MNLYQRYLKQNPDIVFTVVDKEAILLEQNTGKYYSLNPVGTRIWNLLTEYGQLSEVYDQLLAEFDVEETQLKKDLEHLVTQFIENGLLL